LFNTKLSETKAEDIINHLDKCCSVRATARLVQVSKETIARLLRASGRHAGRFHEQHVHDLRPLALEFDEQWSFVKKSKNSVGRMNAMPLATCRTIRPWRWTASSWCP
jgi:hypothetical protein